MEIAHRFRAMLHEGMDDLAAARLGTASHDPFDLACGLVLLAEIVARSEPGVMEIALDIAGGELDDTGKAR
jgi:hypothetical protein